MLGRDTTSGKQGNGAYSLSLTRGNTLAHREYAKRVTTLQVMHSATTLITALYLTSKKKP